MTLDLGGINWLAVVVAAAASWILGAIWYAALFGKAWGRLHAFSDEKMQQLSRRMGVSFATYFVTDLVLAAGVSLVVGATGAAGIVEGVLLGLVLGVGLSAAQVLQIYVSVGHPSALYLIDAAKGVASVVVVSLILAAWR